jgi:hypothetical protein
VKRSAEAYVESLRSQRSPTAVNVDTTDTPCEDTTDTPCDTAIIDPSELEDAYCRLDVDKMWRLPSGTTVEETLHQSYSMTGLSDNVRNSIQNWTVMVDNEEMRDLFLADDWAAIQKYRYVLSEKV